MRLERRRSASADTPTHRRAVVAAGPRSSVIAVDWISADAASNLVGLDLTDNELERAAVDVYELMRWTPAFGVDLADGSDRSTMQAGALGRAIAWQAAYLRRSDPLEALDERELSAESIGSYSRSYREGSSSTSPVVAKRTRETLARAGLLRLTGESSRGSREGPEMIPVIW